MPSVHIQNPQQFAQAVQYAVEVYALHFDLATTDADDHLAEQVGVTGRTMRGWRSDKQATISIRKLEHFYRFVILVLMAKDGWVEGKMDKLDWLKSIFDSTFERPEHYNEEWFKSILADCNSSGNLQLDQDDIIGNIFLGPKAHVLYKLAWKSYYVTDYPEAFAYLDRAYDISVATKNDLLRGLCINARHFFHMSRGEIPGEAFTELERARRIFEGLGDSSGKAQVLRSLGHLFMMRGNYKSALQYLSKASELAKSVGNTKLQASLCLDLGNLHIDEIKHSDQSARTIQNIERARVYYDEGRKLVDTIEDKVLKSVLSGTLANFYDYTENYQEAILWYGRAISAAEDAGDQQNKHIHLNNYGDTLYKMGRYDEALSRFEEVLTFCRTVGDREGECLAEANIADTLVTLARCEEAWHHYNQSLVLVQKLGINYINNTLAKIKVRLNENC